MICASRFAVEKGYSNVAELARELNDLLETKTKPSLPTNGERRTNGIGSNKEQPPGFLPGVRQEESNSQRLR
jgi:hypothetical protein